MPKYYHQVNHQGFYLYSFVPEESPREPGVLLIPAGCTDIPPPNFDVEKEIPRVTENGWVLVPISGAKKSFFRKLWEKFKK